MYANTFSTMFGMIYSIKKKDKKRLFFHLATSGFSMVSNAIEKYSEYCLSCCMWTYTRVIEIEKIGD
jgi:hypothetical protein